MARTSTSLIEQLFSWAKNAITGEKETFSC